MGRDHRAAARLLWSVVAVGVLAAVALVVLWPQGPAPDLGRRPNTYVKGWSNGSTPCAALRWR
ncbi:MAG: hypothetical protein R2755_08610 [Acidimicrobiales bacterium]